MYFNRVTDLYINWTFTFLADQRDVVNVLKCVIFFFYNFKIWLKQILSKKIISYDLKNV